MLLLNRAENAFDLNIMLTDFLADEVIEYVEKHKKILFALSEVWNTTIRRTVFSTDDITFPDGLLLIPAVFHRLGWIVKNPQWTEIGEKAQMRFDNDANLVDALIVMFTNAMQDSLNSALDKFCLQIKSLKHKPEEYQQAQELRKNIGNYYGWPTEKLMGLAETA